MKLSLIIASMIITGTNFGQTSVSQSTIALLTKSMWGSTINNYKIKEAASLEFDHSTGVMDGLNYTFNEDGTFHWDFNPSCGLHAGEISGNGTWKLENNNTLIMNFKKVNADGMGIRNIEKYTIIKISGTELILKRI